MSLFDADADPQKALAIAVNAKTQRYGTCNTMETLLSGRCRQLRCCRQWPTAISANLGVELRGCERRHGKSWRRRSRIAASEEDWQTEYLAPILSVRVSSRGIDAAMAHIDQYGSGHTDSIVTDNHSTAMRFLREVDSSSVMVNASTRFRRRL